MNAEQKQRAKDALTNCQASDMAALLQEMIATHEPKPVARVTGYYAGYLSIATVDGSALPAGTALYAAPPHQSEHHLEMVNTPAPSVPDEELQAAFDRGLKAGNEQKEAQQVEIHRLHDLLAATPTQPEPPADLVQDSVAAEPVGYLYTNLQSGEYHVSDYDDDYRGPERALWCIEPVYRRARGQS